ncbi:MAG: TIM barrel protein, partial [Ferruginibacter sp.]
MQRRAAIKNISTALVGLGSVTTALANSSEGLAKLTLKGNIRHSVCRWTYQHVPLEVLCASIKKIGVSAIDLIGPGEWKILQQHGVYSSMCNGAEISLTKGFNDPKYHATLEKNYTEHIEMVSKAGYTNLICFSGNRNGMDDESGLKNCLAGLKKIMSIAEKNKVIIQMELFNSKIDHKDYMADSSAWGIELCKQLGSPNFKLLYDIYHMQINEG